MGKRRILFRQVREEWWAGQEVNRRATTLHRMKERIRCHIAPFFDDCPIDKITDVEINQYVKDELDHGNRLTHGPLNQNSVSKSLQIINQVMEYAKAKKYIKSNSMDLVTRLKTVPSMAWYVYSIDEVDAIIEVARPKWMGDAILASYHNGLRKEEVFGLQWDKIDFSRHCLRVKTTITAISPHEYFIDDPKNPWSERDVLFDDETEEMLRKRWEKRTSDVWVFADKYGRAINPWYSTKYFRNACVAAGIDIHRFHDLRHTHITELVEAGKPLPMIQARVGHKDIRTTMRYTHITVDMQQSAVDFLNRRRKNSGNHIRLIPR